MIQLYPNLWQKMGQVNDLSSGQYSVNKNVIIKMSVNKTSRNTKFIESTKRL